MDALQLLHYVHQLLEHRTVPQDLSEEQRHTIVHHLRFEIECHTNEAEALVLQIQMLEGQILEHKTYVQRASQMLEQLEAAHGDVSSTS